MRGACFARAALAAAAFGAAGAGLLCCSGAETPESVLGRVPAEVGGLRAGGADESYPAAAIFAYLDGGAEVYLAYHLHSCRARRYTGSAGELVVDLFAMGSSADAFGVFSRDQDGEPVAVGQGGRLRDGWLSAWKGPFYLSVTADRADARAQGALLELGRAVAAAIRNEGQLPELLALLPAEGLDVGRRAYVHDHVTLASHVMLPDGNPLGLGKTTEVAVGRYPLPNGDATLLVVRYAGAEAAAAATDRLAKAWATVPGMAGRDAGGRWRAAASQGPVAAVAVGSPDEETVHALLAAALAGSAGR